jgi:hypothetical protein
MSWPCSVVRDDAELVALYIPRGATFKTWAVAPAPPNWQPVRQLTDALWRRDTLRLMYPGAHHSVWVSWASEGSERRFHGYYINMEEPFRRTEIGFDTNDHTLDVVVAPDRSWEWKDKQELAARIQQGVYSAEFAAAVRAEGERLVAALERNAPPFSDGWERWLPPSEWRIPGLPADWDTLPATLWERRRWAYGDIAPP